MRNMGYATGPAGKSKGGNVGSKPAPRVIGRGNGGNGKRCGMCSRGGMGRGYLGKRGR